MFVDTLDELSWMDESSKKKAQEKVGRRPGREAPVRWPRGDHHHTHFRERAMSGGWGSLRKGLWTDMRPPPAPPARGGGGHSCKKQGSL